MKLKAWMKWVGAVAVVAAAGYGYHAFEQYRMAPQLNLHPSKFMVIHGKISPKYSKVKLHISYQSNNPSCQVTINWFEGVYANSSKWFTYNIDSKKDGSYSLKVPMDKLQKGYCDWGTSILSYYIQTTPGMSARNGIDALYDKPKTKPPKLNVVCQHDVWDHKPYLMCTDDTNQKSFSVSINNPTLELNFKYMKRIPR
jgi:hypothetical protein